MNINRTEGEQHRRKRTTKKEHKERKQHQRKRTIIEEHKERTTAKEKNSNERTDRDNKIIKGK